MKHQFCNWRTAFTALAVLGGCAMLSTAQAATTTATGSGSYSSPGEPYPNPPVWVQPNPFFTINVPQFNPSLGTLTGVTVQFTWSLMVSDTAYATTSSPQLYYSDTPGELDCFFPGSAGSELAGTFPVDMIVGSGTQANPTGPVPGNGSLGNSASDNGVISGPVAATDVPVYVGTGDVQFFVSQGGLVISGESGGNYFESAGSAATASVLVTYTYTPSGPPPPTGPFVTFTQGGWHTQPHGQNPGYYLTKYFTAVTGGSISIGTGNSYTFTSAAAIEAFLPQGTAPRPLPGSATFPPGPAGSRSVIWGQLLAVKLAVAFSDASVFSSGLSSLHVQSGPFKTLTLAQVVTIADDMVGGSALPLYTPAGVTIDDMNTCLDNVNSSFDGGTVDTGFLN